MNLFNIITEILVVKNIQIICVSVTQIEWPSKFLMAIAWWFIKWEYLFGSPGIHVPPLFMGKIDLPKVMGQM